MSGSTSLTARQCLQVAWRCHPNCEMRLEQTMVNTKWTTLQSITWTTGAPKRGEIPNGKHRSQFADLSADSAVWLPLNYWITLLNHLGRILPQKILDIHSFDGQTDTKVNSKNRQVFTFLFPGETVWENVLFWGQILLKREIKRMWVDLDCLELCDLLTSKGSRYKNAYFWLISREKSIL